MIRLLPLLLCATLSAQAIDRDQSRFMSEPHGRPGTCAPYRLVFKASQHTERIEVRHGNVMLVHEVAAQPEQTVVAVIPVYVAPGVSIHAAGDELTPRLPLRRLEPDYEQPYVAVFAADALYARPLLPSAPGEVMCDYFENREFFADWRMLDGYDAVVMFNPEAQRPPAGTQRAIAEFCCVGGVAVIVGSFRMGERVEGLPAPAEPELLTVAGVRAQRMAYGAGAIYRIEFDELRTAGRPHAVLRAAIVHHTWHGANRAPGGKPYSRAPSTRPILLEPGQPEDPAPGPMFFGLAVGLLALCAVLPLLAKRLRGGAYWGMPILAVGAIGIGALGRMQQQPRPLLDAWAVLSAESPDAARPAWLREFLLPGQDVPEVLEVRLGAEPHALPRPWRNGHGLNGWQVDYPLQAGTPGPAVELSQGRVGDVQFRDYAAMAWRGEGGFGHGTAPLLEWWLEENAWRGRQAQLAPAQWRTPTDDPDVEKRTRGALWVVNIRAATDTR
ncbi:MAG: hypothetical protein KF696_05755 [Planctomycetes bacterium]|nr:hypothetical protein [Planctomycetota bacterium]MCW8136391.1 hypothetical protein [Planctomycetota bacterium]